MNGWHAFMWHELQQAAESFCNSGNSKIKSHYFPWVYLFTIVVLGAWEREQ